MPPYPGNNLAALMYENDQNFFWQNELVTAGTTSRAYQLRRERGASYPNGFSVELAFSATPGVFEFDVMGADTDQLSHYVSLATITTVNATFVGRADLVSFWPKYVALYAKTLPNAVSVTAQITR